MSELVAEDRAVRATIDVSYQSEPLVGMLVPSKCASGTKDDGMDRSSRAMPPTADFARFR